MLRHLAFTFGIVLLAATTVLVMADAGAFDALGTWLAQRYEAESFLVEARPAWPWLQPLAVILAAGLVAWVAVEPVTWAARFGVLGAAIVAAFFLSLTLALYGVVYNPFPAVLAAIAGFLMGGVLAETPNGRRQREWLELLGARADAATLAAWKEQPEDAPWTRPTVRETAVLAVRVLNPLPNPEEAAQRLTAMSCALEECARELKKRLGVVLEPVAGDGVRAFFGQLPVAAHGDLEAAADAALELAARWKESATNAAAEGAPPLQLGLGLSLGPLLAGRHGLAASPVWAATGPAAEQARQLASLNARHRTTILVGRRAAAVLRERFDVTAVEGDAIHKLIARKATATPEADEDHGALLASDAESPLPTASTPAPTPSTAKKETSATPAKSSPPASDTKTK